MDCWAEYGIILPRYLSRDPTAVAGLVFPRASYADLFSTVSFCLSLLILCSVFFASACNTDKLAQLEKENRELKAKLEAVSQGNLLLQEKCAKQARVEFDSEGWTKDQSATFTNHYNQKLNKCFIEVNSIDAKTAKDGTIFENTYVSDAFEGKDYGEYGWHSDKVKKYWEVPPFDCKVTSLSGEESICHSEEEFKKAMNQYME